MLELIPEALAEDPHAGPLTALGHLMLLLTENTFSRWAHKDQEEHEQHVVLHGHALVERLHHKARQLNSTASKTDLLGLTVHACIDGFGIMTGLVQAAGTSLLILCAVLLHKLPWGAVSPASGSHLDRTCIQRQ